MSAFPCRGITSIYAQPVKKRAAASINAAINRNTSSPWNHASAASRHDRPPGDRGLIVGVADLRASDRPHQIITTYALGSCLGISCYDRVNRVGGLLHAMLPDSAQSSRKEFPPAMFLDTGVPALLQSVLELGGDPKHSEYKVFGGARVGEGTDFFNIGSRNIETMMTLVHQYDLHVVYWHVGGQTNRTITLYLDNGDISLRMPGRQEVFV